MSVRGCNPKISSETVTEPDSLPSRPVTFNSISRASRFLPDRNRRRRRVVGELEFTGLRHAVRQLLLHCIAHRDPAAFDTGHRTLDHDQAALDIGLHDFEIKRSHAVDAEMSRHLLVLEGPARVLTATGRTDRTMR